MTKHEKLTRIAQKGYFLGGFDKYVKRTALSTTSDNLLGRIRAMYERGKAYFPYVERTGTEPNMAQLTVEAKSLPYQRTRELEKLYELLFDTYHKIDRRAADRKLAGKPKKRVKELKAAETLRANEYLLRQAFHLGTTRHLSKDGDVKVYRMVEKDACKHCIRLLSKNGRPRIFSLAKLQRNGDNIGRKEPLAVIGSIHVNCRCSPPIPLKPWTYIMKTGRVGVNFDQLPPEEDKEEVA